MARNKFCSLIVLIVECLLRSVCCKGSIALVPSWVHAHQCVLTWFNCAGNACDCRAVACGIGHHWQSWWEASRSKINKYIYIYIYIYAYTWKLVRRCRALGNHYKRSEASKPSKTSYCRLRTCSDWRSELQGLWKHSTVGCGPTKRFENTVL